MDYSHSTPSILAPSQQFFKKVLCFAFLHQPKLFLTILLTGLLLPFILFDFGQLSLAKFDKNYWGRTELTAAFAQFRYHILGDKIYDLTITGPENWLMYTGEKSLDDYQRTIPFTPEQLLIAQERLDALEEHLVSQGIRLLVVIVPNKNTIYSEKMPQAIPILNEASRLDQLIVYMHEHGQVDILDLRPALISAKMEREVYYPTDTHWSPHGAHIAYQEILNRLAANFPQMQPYSLDDFEYVQAGSEGGLSIHTQTRVDDAIYNLSPRFPTLYSMRNMTDAAGVKYIYSAHPDKSLPRLVMYHDSFAALLTPLMSNHFSRAVYIWSPKVDMSFIAEEDPDVVIIERTERYLDFLFSLPPK